MIFHEQAQRIQRLTQHRTTRRHSLTSRALDAYMFWAEARAHAPAKLMASPWYDHVVFDLHNDPKFKGNGCKFYFRY